MATENDTKTPAAEVRKEDRRPRFHWSIYGCLIPSIIIMLTPFVAALLIYLMIPSAKVPEYVAKAEPKVEKKLEQIRNEPPVDNVKSDLDSTVSALYSMEQALLKAKNFEQLTDYIVQENGSNVAPEVRMLKYRFFNIYKKLLTTKDSIAETESLYNTSKNTIVDIASVIDPMLLTYDKDQAQKIWLEHLEKAKLSREMKQRLEQAQDEMLDFMFDFDRINRKYYSEWEKLCAYRDRSYLAVFEGNLDEAIKNASAAVSMAPLEKEAHILLAMALLEHGGETDISSAKAVIEDFMKKNPGNAAGYLLRGVLEMKEKNTDKALIDFDQAATYFPKLHSELSDRLGIYKKRSFLNKSKEGRVIVNAYRSMMSGAGYYSPDFQKARVHLKNGQNDLARNKIFDHFFRRRHQAEWDKVLDDFKFSYSFLNTELFQISGGAKVDVDIEPAFFTNSVILKITNKSDKSLHNITILLCVRFTDMFKGDYVSFPVGETVALLNPGQSIEIGRKNINDLTENLFGTRKKFKDIIEYAAVMISDESICWVESKLVDTVKDDSEAKKHEPKITDEAMKSIKSKFSDKTVEVITNAVEKAIDKGAEKLNTEINKALAPKDQSTTGEPVSAPTPAPAAGN